MIIMITFFGQKAQIRTEHLPLKNQIKIGYNIFVNKPIKDIEVKI